MKYRLPGSLLACLAMATLAMAAEVDDPVMQAEARRVEVMAKAQQTAVAIFAGGQGGGSGVLISPDGYALSNFHVTRGAGYWMRCGLADGKLYDAVIVGIDPVGDVSLIKLLGRDDFPHAELGDSDRVRVGDWVFAVGNPFLLATDFQPTVTYGMVSGVRRYQYPAGTLLEYADCIQTDASINPGNSGGPLFNSQGQLIGINGRGSFEKRGRVNVGVGYAISINQIKHFMGCLRSGRIVDHATLGARVASGDDGRVLVADVLETSDAFRRGLRYGDDIVAFGGRAVRTVNAFKNALGVFPKGWRIPLTYRREGQTYDVLVRLAGVHGQQELIDKVTGRPRVQPGQPRRERPRDGEEPPPEDQPAPDKSPQPAPSPAQRAAEELARRVPAEVKQQYRARRGYANYHFNLLERERVWSAFASRGSFGALTDDWHIEGQLIPGGDARFDLGDKQVACTLPGGTLTLKQFDQLSSAVDPPGSGGLMAAMWLWRRLLVMGPEKFGDVYYYGTMPLAGAAEPVDVLVGSYGGVECQFYFDAPHGQLVCVELFRHADDDPCELHFSQYEEIAGRWLPRRLEVRYGDQTYAVLSLDVWSFDGGDQP